MVSSEQFVNRVIRASAGSGKTHQLTNRYIGLLAAGVSPETILATTFTRKAAGEILNRVLERLAKAASKRSEATELAKQVGLVASTAIDFAAILRQLLRNLHRVRIGTLDSFYMTVAGTFGFELGLPVAWTICEQIDDNRLRQDAIGQLLEREDLAILVSLYQRLSSGEAKRGVQQEMLKVVDELYVIYRETPADAWDRIVVPAGMSTADLGELVGQIASFDLASLPQMQKARDEDIIRANSGNWAGVVSRGVGGKVAAGASEFNRKLIPPALVALYARLIRHAAGILTQLIADQNKATHEFLDHFHNRLWDIKQETGALRFNEVTQIIVDALENKTLGTQSLAFRLDGGVEHLLLDEFQDTSLPQWRVLEPIARSITHGTKGASPRSFFCVGDIKQAIYGWRGGIVEIFNSLSTSLGKLEEQPLDVSRRSAPPIIDAVNSVFGSLTQFGGATKCQDGLAEWQSRFTEHTTVKEKVPGYVYMHTGPKQKDGQGINEHRGSHCGFVAGQIRDIVAKAPQRTVGVLCRKNDTVSRMIFELRRIGVEASEEGGNPLTDSPAVELILSLLTLADHPGHTIAWFHLTNSPLSEHLGAEPDREQTSSRLRRELQAQGYGQFVRAWAVHLARHCAVRDLNRLQQLVEVAYAYDSHSTLRASDFVAWVRATQVPDPSAASVRVMTIHAAKGLEFDVVALPELDASLAGQTPPFVLDRDPKTLDVNLVCRYVDETTRQFLGEDVRRAYQMSLQRRVEESLSLLYVALTRAVYALYMFIPGPRECRSDPKDGWHKLLLQTLAPAQEVAAQVLLFEHGDPNWFAQVPALPAASSSPPAPRSTAITFKIGRSPCPRGRKHVAPSQLEGRGRVSLAKLFDPGQKANQSVGILFHHWFATIEWLDDGSPSKATLAAAAQAIRSDLPADIWNDIDQHAAKFLKCLQNAAIRGALQRSAYAKPVKQVFPVSLAKFWKESWAVRKVECERRFLVQDGDSFLGGSLDRVVWLADADATVAADVIDFKTDAIKADDEAACRERVEFYRPQMDAYRRAVARIARIPEDRVALRLLFTAIGKLVEL